MKIAISAGDPSGDEHGARIISTVRTLCPEATVFGMGGSALRSVGVETLIDSETDASVMGFVDVIKSLGTLRRALKRMTRLLEERAPDVLLLVDYQDFNLLLAKKAKRLGIRTVFFIAPTVWAWRSGRAKSFRKYVDALACIFPFEPAVFRSLGYDNAQFVGHPFGDNFSQFTFTREKRAALRKEFGIEDDELALALFAGSRNQEVRNLLPLLVETLHRVRQTLPNVKGIIPVPSSISEPELRERIHELGAEEIIRIVPQRSVEVLGACDAGLIKSGTSNLQAALAGLPFAMMYRAGWLMRSIVRLCSKVDSYSIVNIIRPNTVREFVSEQALSPAVLADEAIELLRDEPRRKAQLLAFHEIKNFLTPKKDSCPSFSHAEPQHLVAERVARMVIRDSN
ncbi:MAG: lipid-A-disaccharide synthase [Bdellovibrionota bacterium]